MAWAGRSPDEVIRDLSAVFEAMPDLPEPTRLEVPFRNYLIAKEAADQAVATAFRRRETWATEPFMARLAERASADMFAFSRQRGRP